MEASMAGQAGIGRLFGSFNRTFWVVNFFELFERGAYYATLAVLTKYAVDVVMADLDHASFIFGIVYALVLGLLYFYPVISGALADKLGYKTMLTFAFACLIIGYYLLSHAGRGAIGPFIASYMLIGLGAGTFKPIVSATIARVTTTEQRTSAYSIYYWLINFGALSSNLTLSFYINEVSLYHYVFIISSVLIGVNVAILLLFFRNPVEPRKELSVSQAINLIRPAFKDRMFVMLLIIYSGFWFMYTFQTYIQLYMDDYDRMPGWFNLQMLACVNPGTIIIVGPMLTKAVERFNSINVMMTGISISALGIFITGFSEISALFIVGIIIFSMGEFITHPGFIAYVSRISPKDKLSIYMASIFVSVGIGTITGSVVQGALYDYLGRGVMMPKLYIALVVSVGLATIIGFIFYNRLITKHAQKEDPAFRPAPSIWSRTVTMAVVLLLIPATAGVGYAAGTSVFHGEEEDDGGFDWSDYTSVPLDIPDIPGSAQEGDTVDELLQIDVPNVVEVTLTLTWTDEADAGVRYNNEPDQFRLTVTPPNGTARTGGPTANSQGGAGTVSVNFDFPLGKKEFFNGTGQWAVGVELVTAGDQVLWRPGIGLLDRADTGNAYTLSVECTYMERT
jgi:MFS family permease